MLFQKTQEQKQKILDKVQNHHYFVENYWPDEVIFTALVGSQNYNLDTEYSDIDTITFILPSLSSFYTTEQLISTEYELEDGKAVIKDIRLFFKLLRKSTPNSIEWICSHYMYINPIYEAVIEQMRENCNLLSSCDILSMLHAIAGTATQLHGRNMTIGKRFSHVLRLDDMLYTYTTNFENGDFLALRPGDMYMAMDAKIGHCNLSDDEIKNECDKLTAKISQEVTDYHLTSIDHKRMALAKAHLQFYERHLFEAYLHTQGFEKIKKI